MIIGAPKEVKNSENRVGITPACVIAYRNHGHEVLVETQAGQGVGFTDQDYMAAGAKIVTGLVKNIRRKCEKLMRR